MKVLPVTQCIEQNIMNQQFTIYNDYESRLSLQLRICLIIKTT